MPHAPHHDPRLTELLRVAEGADDWETRLRLVIEFGRSAPEMPEEDRVEQNRIPGCSGKAWTTCRRSDQDPGVLSIVVAAESPVIHGLLCVLSAFLSGRTPEDVATADPTATFEALGLGGFLTAQRAIGIGSAARRMRQEASTLQAIPST